MYAKKNLLIHFRTKSMLEMSLNYTSTDYGRHECLSRMHEFKSKKEKKKCWTSILTNLYYIFLLILNLSLKAFGNEDSQIFHEPQQNDISIGN